MAELLASFLSNLNYWTIFVLMTIESSFIPLPSEVVVPPAAYLVAQGNLDGFGVILSSVSGSLVGALINYALAYWLGRPIMYAFANSKVGKMLLLSEEKLKRAEVYFDRRGAISTFVGRLIPGIRQLISLPAGLARMNLIPFILYTILGAGLWCCVLFWLGWWAAGLPGIDTTEKLVSLVEHYSHIIGLSILALVVAYICYKLLKRIMQKPENTK